MARILIVDDEVHVREVLADAVIADGHDVEQADDGSTALAMLRAGSAPDLLITDGCMPKVNGIELARQARRLGVPKILMITATEDEEFQEVARAAGVDRILMKPVDMSDLSRTVAELLQ